MGINVKNVSDLLSDKEMKLSRGGDGNENGSIYDGEGGHSRCCFAGECVHTWKCYKDEDCSLVAGGKCVPY